MCTGLESREYGRRDPSCWPRGTLYPQKVALTSPTSGGRSDDIVLSWTQATESSLVLLMFQWCDAYSKINGVLQEFRWPVWPSGQSSWLQIQRTGFDSWRCQIFWEVVGLEWGPLTLVSTIEYLLGRHSSSFGLEIREYGCRDPLYWPHYTLYLQKLALTLLTTGVAQSV
jgi:hypothetical protein